jgi:transcriptional regulator with XRE-family HTH domain
MQIYYAPNGSEQNAQQKRLITRLRVSLASRIVGGMEWWDRVRELRAEHGLTGKELGEAVGVSPQRVSDVENGRYPNVELYTLERYAEALRTTVGFLVAGSDPLGHRQHISSDAGTDVPHSEGTGHVGSLAPPRTPDDVVAELAAASEAFSQLAHLAGEWSVRIALAASVELGVDAAREQVTVAHIQTPGPAPDVRDDGGSSHLKDRPKSA